MSKIIITYKDWVKCNIQGLTDYDKQMLVNAYKIFVPMARFSPKYKLGVWDGYIRFFELTGNTYVSLIPEILSKLDLSHYEDVECIYAKDLKSDVDLGEVIDNNYMSDICWEEGHRLAGQPIRLEDHQVRVVNAFLHNHRGVVSSCTGSGKTLISAALFRKIKPFGRSVIVVPSKDLAQQSAEDYKKWGLDCGIVGCGLREFGHNVTVCTWQTINSLEKRKNQKDSLTADELKQLTADVICIIFDECFAGDTLITMADGTTKKIKECQPGDKIISLNEKTNVYEVDEIIKRHKNLNSYENMYEIQLENDKIIQVTGNHKLLTKKGWKEVKNLSLEDELISYDK